MPFLLPPSLSGPDLLLEYYISSYLCLLMSEVLVIFLLPRRDKEICPFPTWKHDRLISFMTPDPSSALPREVAAPSHIPSAPLSFTWTPLLRISSFLILHASGKVQELLDLNLSPGRFPVRTVLLPCASPSSRPDLARLTVGVQLRPSNWASDCTRPSDEQANPGFRA